MIRQITVLQNFKHFLKMKMNETEIVEYILNFSFIR